MNAKQKLDYVKKHIQGLNYMNTLLKDALSYHEEIGTGDYQFLYLNKIYMIPRIHQFIQILIHFIQSA